MRVEQWPVRELSELAEFSSGGTPSKSRLEFWGGDIPWLTVRDLKTLHPKGFLQTLTQEGSERVRVMPPQTVYVLVRGMALFKDFPVALVNQPAAFNQDIKALVPAKGVDPEFLAYALLAHKSAILQLVDQAGHGTGRLDTERLKSFPIPIPGDLEEQRKIAEILRTWDDAIESVVAAQKARRAMNSARSSKLLTGGAVATESRNRFLLGDLFDERNELGDAGDALLSVTQGNGIVDQQTVGRKNSSSADRSKYKLVEPGDIAYNTMRMWQGASGLSSVRGIVSPAYTVVTPRDDLIFPRFAAHLFKADELTFVFERFSQGLTSDTWNLKFPAFARVEVQIPSLQRQIAIATYLDEAKVEIETYSRLEQTLHTQRRGLMQKLLTGQIRVTGDSSESLGKASDE